MVGTRRNGRSAPHTRTRRSTCPSTAREHFGRPPVGSVPSDDLVDLIVAELHRYGIPASRITSPPGMRSGPAVGSGAAVRPGAVGVRVGDDAIVVVVDRSAVQFLFGELRGGRVGLRTFLRATRARSWENRLCDRAIETALADSARRLLIVCDTGSVSASERERAMRWVREVAHRIGYECSMNGLNDLGTSHLVLFPDTDAEEAARSVVEWCRSGRIRYVRS